MCIAKLETGWITLEKSESKGARILRAGVCVWRRSKTFVNETWSSFEHSLPRRRVWLRAKKTSGYVSRDERTRFSSSKGIPKSMHDKFVQAQNNATRAFLSFLSLIQFLFIRHISVLFILLINQKQKRVQKTKLKRPLVFGTISYLINVCNKAKVSIT